MNVYLTLFKKHLHEARWVLGITALAFFGLAILTVWLTLRGERVLAAEDLNPAAGRRLGIFRGLGGPEMNFSTLAMEVAFWNHPFIVLTILGWAVARGALAVAGEIERGTIDLVLSRPVSRATYLLSHATFTVFSLMALATALVFGCWIGSHFLFAVKTPPSVAQLLRPAGLVVLLGTSVYGYTTPFSAIDRVRWRPGVIALGLTLAGLIALSIAPQFEGYDWLEKTSVFRAYTPVTVAMKADYFPRNAAALACVSVAGMMLALGGFMWRDLPANS